MKLTDKINFRQPKYMLPLIVYLPVIGTAYFVFDMFDTKIEDKPAANLQTTDFHFELIFEVKLNFYMQSRAGLYLCG